jgi:type II secretory pathway pseudopilin PulG
MNWQKSKTKYFKKTRGFTLIELLIYSVFLVVIGVGAVSFFIQVVNVTETSRRSRESLDNARRAIDMMAQEIKHAKGVYTPTSILDGSMGQLSLETTRDLPTGETATYVDFYLDGERLFVKRESQAEEMFTSDKVTVQQLTFKLLDDSSEKPAVQITLTVDYADQIAGPSTSVTLTSTATLRSYE